MAADFIARVSWVVMGPDPALATCLRCEDVSAPPTKQVPFAALESFVNGFAAEHSACVAVGGDDDSQRPAAPGAGELVESAAGEEPSRQVEEVEAAAAVALPDHSSARKVANGPLYFDCRVHGTQKVIQKAGWVKCLAVGCAEAVMGRDVVEVAHPGSR